MKKISKRIMSALLASTLGLSIMFGSITTANAATYVKVYLDGELLTYVEAQPQIINDRTMVPLTETATHFGLTSNWNAQTGTMVFTGGGKNLMHVVKDTVVYVDGVPKTFDYGSVIVDSRTLMPIRMLAEVLDCEVEWDGTTGVVNISTGTPVIYKSEGPANSGNTSTPVSGNPMLYSATVTKSTVEIDKEIEIVASSNKATTKVKVTDSSDKLIDESTNFTTDTEGAYFKLKYTPTDSGEITLRVYAGDSTGYSTSYKTINLTVLNGSENIVISKITLEEDKVNKDDTVYVTVKTSVNVKKVVINNNKGKVVKTKTSATSKTSTVLTWEFEFRADGDTGKLTYEVVAYDVDDNSNKDTFTFTVNSSSSSSDSTSEYPVVKDVSFHDDYSSSDVIEGKTIKIVVKTNKGVGYVELLDPYDTVLKTMSNYTDYDSSSYYWEFSFTVRDEGRYRANAYEKKNSSDYDFDYINLDY